MLNLPHHPNPKDQDDAKSRLILRARDFRILEEVHKHRALTSIQIHELLFRGPSRSRSQDRLKRLAEHKYLRSIEQPMPPFGGKSAYVYAIAKKGATLLEEYLDEDVKVVRIPKTEDKLTHLLRTNDVRIVFAIRAEEADLTIRQWKDDRTLYQEWGKETAEKAPLIPDGYVELEYKEGSDTYRYSLFLEVDLGTEPLGEWRSKIKRYLHYQASGLYEKAYHTPHMQVLTVCRSDRRMKNLISTTDKAGGADRFWFSTFDRMIEDNPFTSPMWFVPRYSDPQALL